MQRLLPLGRLFFGLFLVGIGLQHFLHSNFRPFLIPNADAWPGLRYWAMAAGALFSLAGLAICFNVKTRAVAVGTGVLLLLLFLLLHLSSLFRGNPQMLAMWTNPLKCLAFSGGAFILAAASKNKKGKLPASRNPVRSDKLFLTGLFFFCAMLIVFGLMHFVYADFAATLVPEWIPAPLFWTYAAGIALMGSGVALLVNVKPTVVALLLAAMLFVWVLLLHIPRALVAPASDNGNELTSVFQALGFCGVALILATLLRKSSVQTSVRKEASLVVDEEY